jgi:hypothetical protein
MAEKEPMQRTPKGYEIPVPTREQVLGDLAKATKPVEKSSKSRRKNRSGK